MAKTKGILHQILNANYEDIPTNLGAMTMGDLEAIFEQYKHNGGVRYIPTPIQYPPLIDEVRDRFLKDRLLFRKMCGHNE